MIEPIPPISAIEPPKPPDQPRLEPPDALKPRPALNGARRFIIQFSPDTPLPESDEISCTAAGLQGIIPDDVQRSLAFSDETAWLCRLYPAQLGAEMDEQAAANRADPQASEIPLPGFSRYYRLRFTGGMENDYIADTLARSSTITAVQPEFEFDVSVTHADPDYSKQDYLIAAPKGISVEAAWNEGADGRDISIGMAEGGSGAIPQDIEIKVPLGLGPTQSSHMISVAGILVAKDNNQGIVGVAPLSNLVFSATDAKPTTTARINPPTVFVENDHYRAIALLNSPSKLRAGDIVNFSIGARVNLDQKKSPTVGPSLPATAPGRPGWRIAKKSGPSGAPDLLEQVDSLISLEIDPAMLKLIQELSLKGVTVCMAAGNGYRSTYMADATKHPDVEVKVGAKLEANWIQQVHTVNRADTAKFRDGGGIVVAAGFWSNNRSVNERLNYSNSGTRVDCFAQGAVVRTWGPTATLDFSGTSAACPIVAGAAALVQCYLKQNYGVTFKPSFLRALLSDPVLNTPPKAGDQIGAMPDLAKIISLLKTKTWQRDKLVTALEANAATTKAQIAAARQASGTPPAFVHDPYTIWIEKKQNWDDMIITDDIFNQPLQTPAWVPAGSALV